MDPAVSTTDHDLMHRSRRGDATAFALLVERWQAPLARLVAQLAGPRADVEDLCQEVFVRVLRALDRYQPSHAFSTWMYHIALNVARDSRRREQRRPQILAESHDTASSDAAAADLVARGEKVDVVTAALASLADDLREILVLKHFGQLSMREIAEATHLPLGTVKSRLQLALKHLRGELRRRGLTDAE